MHKIIGVKAFGDVKIYDNVKIGRGTIIEGPCIIGKPPRGKKAGQLRLVLGRNCIIRPFTTIYAGSKIGNDFQTGQGASIREDNVIGDEVSVGTNAVLEFGNRIGKGTRIHSGCFMEMARIGRFVFVGPNTVFTDDPHPMGCPYYKKCKGGVIVEDLAKIGANVTVWPGVRIGRGALVAAGSVVTHNVPKERVVAGNPAVILRRITDLKCYSGRWLRPYVWKPYGRAKGMGHRAKSIEQRVTEQKEGNER
jgi:acetyltransferase-like isoleucine patch superfamily enzyme